MSILHRRVKVNERRAERAAAAEGAPPTKPQRKRAATSKPRPKARR